ncbi:MAG: hypothetical protein WC575_00810 [Patescibacteria group bacterium]
MEITKFLQSKIFLTTTWIIGIIIILLCVFQVGVMVGARKAGFTYRWGENYHRNFAGPRSGFPLPGLDDRDFIEANGIIGQIIKLDSNSLIIKGRDNVERVVLVNDQTNILRFKDEINYSDLKIDDFVVIIGEPNDTGQIEAKFIRIMPQPPLSNLRSKMM